MAVRREDAHSKSIIASRFSDRTTGRSGDDQIIDQLRRISSVSQEDFEKMRLAEKDNDFFELRKATDIKNPDTQGDPCPPLPIKLIHGSFKHILGVREACSKNGTFLQRSIELRRKPGGSLGFYIRQGDGWERADGIFVSRVVLGTDVDIFELLRVGDEIIKVNDVDVRTMSIEDVSALMQMTRRLILTMKVLTPGTQYRRRISKADSVKSSSAQSDPGCREKSPSGRYAGARSQSIAYGSLSGGAGRNSPADQRRVSAPDRRQSSSNKLSHQSNYKVANMVIGKNKDAVAQSQIPAPANAGSPAHKGSRQRSTKSPVAGRRALSPIRESMVDAPTYNSDTEAGVGSPRMGRRSSKGSASVVSWSDQIYGYEGTGSPTKMKYKPTANDRRKSEASRARPK